VLSTAHGNIMVDASASKGAQEKR